jgi:hypothetical protein
MRAIRKLRRVQQEEAVVRENAPPDTQSAPRFEGREAMIADAAWFRAERRGFAPGHELEDWLEAEREIDARLRQSGQAAQER